LPLTGTGTAATARVQSVSAGYEHTCAVKTDHSLWCWGANGDGQLGWHHDQQPGRGTGERARHRLGRRLRRHLPHVRGQDRWRLWCWGANGDGQLGDGTTTSSLVPVQVSGHATDWAAVSAGFFHTCGVKTDGTLWCWGENTYGQLGDGTATTSLVPVQVSGM
jgi:alpha-tubulin suppressor-like RCC1 family protein